MTKGNLELGTPSLFSIISAFFALKMLLFYCYSSTDFEVHRNWLAITNSLPLKNWYFEETSFWTLDYPPFFAYFEYILSHFATLLDPGIVKIQSEPYFNNKTLFFQRFTVIFSDLLYVYASICCAKSLQRRSQFSPLKSKLVVFVLGTLLITNVGLLMVDNIHFQYNGFLSGFFLLSLINVLEGNFLWGAFWYAVLVNFKHIYLYLAPAYVAYYLKFYCFTDNKLASFSLKNCIKLATVLGTVITVSFGPFLYLGQMDQLLKRLFPLKRGLTHAYWAPNFWALYNFVDFGLYQVLKRIRLLSLDTVSPSYTSGLVQEYDHSILPNITPILTLLVTAGSVIPFCFVVGRGHFLEIVILCAFNSYIFGWHVHEKAILLITVPFTILAVKNRHYCGPFLLLITIGHCSLFPLFFTQFETPVKYLVTVAYSLGACSILGHFYGLRWQVFPFLGKFELIYLGGFIILEVYKLFPHRTFTFLPLMATSIYCAFGIFYCWLAFCWIFLSTEIQLDIKILKYFWAKEQEKLKSKLVKENTEMWEKNLLENEDKNGEKLHIIGGVDISTSLYDPCSACVCLTVLSYPDLELICSITEPVSIDSPYIAGFLAFREVDPVMQIFRKLRNQYQTLVPQVLLVDGNGILHPRGFGLASHLGVLLDIPTVGVAKNLHQVFGLVKDVKKYEEELVSAGQTITLYGNGGTELGCALRPTEESKNPVFVSIGHKIDLPTATKLVIKCSKHRVPESIRHLLGNINVTELNRRLSVGQLTCPVDAKVTTVVCNRWCLLVSYDIFPLEVTMLEETIGITSSIGVYKARMEQA